MYRYVREGGSGVQTGSPVGMGANMREIGLPSLCLRLRVDTCPRSMDGRRSSPDNRLLDTLCDPMVSHMSPAVGCGHADRRKNRIRLQGGTRTQRATMLEGPGSLIQKLPKQCFSSCSLVHASFNAFSLRTLLTWMRIVRLP